MWDDIQRSITSTHIHQHANILSATSRLSPEKSHSLALSIYLSVSLCRPHYCICKEWQRGEKVVEVREKTRGNIHSNLSILNIQQKPVLGSMADALVLQAPKRGSMWPSCLPAQIRSGHIQSACHTKRAVALPLKELLEPKWAFALSFASEVTSR